MRENAVNTDFILDRVNNYLASESDKYTIMDKIVELLIDSVPYYDWAGFYLVKGGRLELGPFRGAPSPHTVIEMDSGICGAAVRSQAAIIVDDVNADPRYLACSLETKSEIVVPMFKGKEVIGEIDIDSHSPAAFGEEDKILLEKIAELVSTKF